MADIKQQVLSRLMRGETPQIEAQEDSMGEKVMKALEMPGRATRAAIGAYQQDEPILDAAKAQFSFDAPDAPSGADLAEHVQDKYDIESPAALAAMATAADVIDPTMLIPGGQITKAGKLGALMKMAGKGDTAADILKKAKPSQFGKVAIVPSKADLEMEAMKRAAQQRVAMQEAAKKKKALDVAKEPELSDFEKRLKAFREKKYGTKE